jgi:hypothetical protein
VLTTAYHQGRAHALARFGIKLAKGMPMGAPQGTPMHPALAQLHQDLHAAPTPMPLAAKTPSEQMHHEIQQQHAANAAKYPAPAELPAPTPFKAAPVQAPASGAGRFMRPMAKGLGLAALGTAGALAYGHHQQRKQDDGHDLVYAPMEGAY